MAEPGAVETHPVQTLSRYDREPGRAPVVVTMRAYDVYCELYQPQPAMVTGNCRGGFGTGELVAFLYARSFPKTEWRVRFAEALRGLHV